MHQVVIEYRRLKQEFETLERKASYINESRAKNAALLEAYQKALQS